jgi:hypothetical protein
MGFTGFGFGETGDSTDVSFQATSSNAVNIAITFQKDNSDFPLIPWPVDTTDDDRYSVERSATTRNFDSPESLHNFQISVFDIDAAFFELESEAASYSFGINVGNQDHPFDIFEDVTDNDEYSISKNIWNRGWEVDALANFWASFDDREFIDGGIAFESEAVSYSFGINVGNQDHPFDIFEDITDNDDYSVSKNIWNKNFDHDGLINIWTMFDDRESIGLGTPFETVSEMFSFSVDVNNSDHIFAELNDVTSNDLYDLERQHSNRLLDGESDSLYNFIGAYADAVAKGQIDPSTIANNAGFSLSSINKPVGEFPDITEDDQDSIEGNLWNRTFDTDALMAIMGSIVEPPALDSIVNPSIGITAIPYVDITENDQDSIDGNIWMRNYDHDALMGIMGSFADTPELDSIVNPSIGVGGVLAVQHGNTAIPYVDITENDQDSIDGNIWMRNYDHDSLLGVMAQFADSVPSDSIPFETESNLKGEGGLVGAGNSFNPELLLDGNVNGSAIYIDDSFKISSETAGGSSKGVIAQLGSEFDLFAPVDPTHHQTGTQAREVGVRWEEAEYQLFDFSWIVKMDDVYHYEYLDMQGGWSALSGAGEYDTPIESLPYAGGYPADVMKFRKQDNILAVIPDIKQTGYGTPHFNPTERYFIRGLDTNGTSSKWIKMTPQFPEATAPISGSGYAKKNYINTKEQPYLIIV